MLMVICLTHPGTVIGSEKAKSDKRCQLIFLSLGENTESKSKK